MRLTCASPSSGSTATSTSNPAPIAPRVSPSTTTRASVTRWRREIMGAADERQETKEAYQSAALFHLPSPVSHFPAVRYTPRMRWYTLLLYAILRAVSRLPLRALQALGAALGWLFWIAQSRKRRIVEANLARVRSRMDEAARGRLARACLVETGKSLV